MPSVLTATGSPQVLILSQCLLGDTLALLPALHALRAAAPRARIELVSDDQGPGRIRAADVLADRGLVDAFHGLLARGSVARKAWNRVRLVARLRCRHWDAGLVLLPPYPPLTTALVRRLDRYLRLAGVRCRSLPAPEPHRRTADGRLAPVPHVSARLLEQVGALGVPMPSCEERRFALPPLADPAPAREAAARIASAAGPGALRLVVAPGSNMPCKRWPLARYGEVIRDLGQQQPLTAFVFGSQLETAACTELRALIPGVDCHLVVGEPVPRVAEMLRQCDLYLGNDTGLMHLAAAVGKPCVAVFSSRDVPGAWDPYGPGHTVFRTAIACEGCLGLDCPLGTYACIQSIAASDVAQACRRAAAKVLASRT